MASSTNDITSTCSASITKKTHRRKASYPLRVVDVTKSRKSTPQQHSQQPENDSSQSSVQYSTDERDTNTDEGQIVPSKSNRNDTNVNFADQLKVFTWILQVFMNQLIFFFFLKYLCSVSRDSKLKLEDK